MIQTFQDELPAVERLLAGVDKAGRGPLVGNIVAAAVVLDDNNPVAGLADSKKLTAARREILTEQIHKHALAYSVVSVEAKEIDRINILQATMLAMRRAVEQLSVPPDDVFVDGNRCPDIACPVTAVVKGDARVAEISVASILAKVTRDAQMLDLHQCFP